MTRTTYRERREARAEKLREWSGKRADKSDAAYQEARRTADGIPFGQPILVGHHSEARARRDAQRIHDKMRASIEHADKADDMARRADTIDAQNRTSIYSDDADAIERLEEKLADLEATRDRIKRYNASCRKAAKAGGMGDLDILDAKQRADITGLIARDWYQVGPGGTFPSYALQNLGGNITRTRKRIEQLKREKEHGPRLRRMQSRYTGECTECGGAIEKGTAILYARSVGARHAECPQESS